MSKYISKITVKWLLSVGVPLLIVLIKPFHLDLHQSVVFASVAMVIIWWAGDLVNKTWSAAGLLLFFLLFSRAPVSEVLYFPMSDSFILVASSFMLSRGIIKTGVARRLANDLIVRRCHSTRQLMNLTFLIGFGLTFLIPHPFSRVILLTGIYVEMLEAQRIKGREFQVLMFTVSATAILSSMMLINGDVILNYAAFRLAGLQMTGSDWIRMMTPPAIGSYVVIWLLFRRLFFKDLLSSLEPKGQDHGRMDGKQKWALAVMGLVILLWFTEGQTHIPAAYPAFGGVVLMAVGGIFEWRDHWGLHYRLLILMSAIFSIGKVLVDEGVAQLMSETLLSVFPGPESLWYIPVLIFGVMGIHMMIGSSLATMSVILVPLIGLTQGVLDPLIVSMLVYLIVNTHFILPIHHTVLLVGYGEKHFGTEIVARYGGWMTGLMVLILYGLFLPWWHFLGFQ